MGRDGGLGGWGVWWLEREFEGLRGVVRNGVVKGVDESEKR